MMLTISATSLAFRKTAMELEQESLAMQQKTANARRRSLHDAPPVEGKQRRGTKDGLPPGSHSAAAAAAVAAVSKSSGSSKHSKHDDRANGQSTGGGSSSNNTTAPGSSSPSRQEILAKIAHGASSGASFPRKFLSRLGRTKKPSSTAAVESVPSRAKLSRIADLEEERKRRLEHIRPVETPDPFRTSLLTIERRKLVLYHKETLIDLRAAATSKEDAAGSPLRVTRNDSSSECADITSADIATESALRSSTLSPDSTAQVEHHSLPMRASTPPPAGGSSAVSDLYDLPPPGTAQAQRRTSDPSATLQYPMAHSFSAAAPVSLAEVYNSPLAETRRRMTQARRPSSSHVSSPPSPGTSKLNAVQPQIGELTDVYNPLRPATMSFSHKRQTNAPPVQLTQSTSALAEVYNPPLEQSQSSPDLAEVYNPPITQSTPNKPFSRVPPKPTAPSTSTLAEVYNPPLEQSSPALAEVYNPPITQSTWNKLAAPKPTAPSTPALAEVYNPPLEQSSPALAEVYNPPITQSTWNKPFSRVPAKPTVPSTPALAEVYNPPLEQSSPALAEVYNPPITQSTLNKPFSRAPPKPTAPSTPALAEVYNPPLADSAQSTSALADVYNPPLTEVYNPPAPATQGMVSVASSDMAEVYDPPIGGNTTNKSGGGGVSPAAVATARSRMLATSNRATVALPLSSIDDGDNDDATSVYNADRWSGTPVDGSSGSGRDRRAQSRSGDQPIPSLQSSKGDSGVDVTSSAPIVESVGSRASSPALSESARAAPSQVPKRSPIFRPNVLQRMPVAPKASASLSSSAVAASIGSDATKIKSPIHPSVRAAYETKLQSSNGDSYDELPAPGNKQSEPSTKISANWNERYQSILSTIETFDPNTLSHTVQDAYLSLIALAQVCFGEDVTRGHQICCHSLLIDR